MNILLLQRVGFVRGWQEGEAPAEGYKLAGRPDAQLKPGVSHKTTPGLLPSEHAVTNKFEVRLGQVLQKKMNSFS